MDLKSFQAGDWVQIWEGGWSILTCSHFADQYTKEVRFGTKPFTSQVIIFTHHGRSTAWIRQKDRDILGSYLSRQIARDLNAGIQASTLLKQEVDKTLSFFQAHSSKIIEEKTYKEFWQRILHYYHPHIQIKYMVDYLNKKQLEKLLPYLERSRVYAEPVFQRSEKFMHRFAKSFARRVKHPHQLILSLTKNELYDFFQGSRLPSKHTLQKRYSSSVILSDTTSTQIFTGPIVKKAERIVFNSEKSYTLKGVAAFPGKIRGVARIINDPKKGTRLKEGEILISGMTRPDFLPIIKRASGFITDSGGMLSHAAIVAREMKKPCITGTRIATKIFKDGDRIELDGYKGEVRKL